MKKLFCFVSIVLFGAINSSLPAQLLVLKGTLTSASGIYADAFQPEAPVLLSFDFSGKPTDIFLGTNQNEARYEVPAQFTVDGNSLPNLPNVFTVSLHTGLLDQPGGEGLFVGNAFNAPGGFQNFLQYFLSQSDILSSRTTFPAGIPLEQFTRTDGFYTIEGNAGVGRIDWHITEYTGSAVGHLTPPSGITPVPESSFFGICGAVVVLSSAAVRRRFVTVTRSHAGRERTELS